MTNIFNGDNEDKNPGYDETRVMPENTLDFNMMMIKSEWGRKNITPELWNSLRVNKGYIDPSTNEVVVTDTKNLWASLGFFTQDIRLANLDSAQVRFCNDRLTLAGDFLSLDPPMTEPFKVVLNSVVPVLETSQSKNGFLRNRLNTLTQESKHFLNEPAKRSFLSGKEMKPQGV